MSAEQRGPADCGSSDKWEARVDDRATYQFAGPEKEPIHQGED